MSTQLTRMQQNVRDAGLDAWVLYDFRCSNDLAWSVLGIPSDAHITRRFAVVIPAQGQCIKVVHRMERLPLNYLRMNERLYDTHESWYEAIAEVLAGMKTVAMEYSPMGALPVVSKVDAGFVDVVRSYGIEVVSSADLIQQFTAVLSPEQIAGCMVTAGQLRDIVMEGFDLIRQRLLADQPVSEYDVQALITTRFAEQGLVTDSGPIVAIGMNAANPHYTPTLPLYSMIDRDRVVVIDAWCKNAAPAAVYADITWVGYTGTEVPADIEHKFQVIRRGRDAAISLVRERVGNGIPVAGYEVDQACRRSIAAEGMGDAFIHRTGHNIHESVHGPGANIDGFETKDTRLLLPGTTFSIEPGIYIPETLGLRTEIDVIIDLDSTVHIPTSPIQTSVLPLLADNWKP